MECLFCKIINNEVDSYTLYEDELVRVILDAYPHNNGHALILPKKHYSTFLDLDSKIVNHIFNISKQMQELLMSKLEAKAISVLFNYGDSQAIKHFHLHLIPNCGLKEDIKKVADIYATLQN